MGQADWYVSIIAMSGLAGRPFGSWQCDDGSMWLRDYLPNDVPNARVFIYGYKSTLVKFKTHSTITTYSDDFLDRLERIRPMYSVESVSVISLFKRKESTNGFC